MIFRGSPPGDGDNLFENRLASAWVWPGKSPFTRSSARLSGRLSLLCQFRPTRAPQTCRCSRFAAENISCR